MGGRTWLAATTTYDLVWYPAPDSYAATNAAVAGAFVLSESYLYTSDAIVDSLEHTGADGILAAQFGEFNFEEKPNRTSRYVSTARHALAELGIDDPTRHILVGTSASPEGRLAVDHPREAHALHAGRGRPLRRPAGRGPRLDRALRARANRLRPTRCPPSPPSPTPSSTRGTTRTRTTSGPSPTTAPSSGTSPGSAT